MNRDWFDSQMRRMGVLKFPPENVDEHYRGLQDIPPEVLDVGVSHALVTRSWFPTIAELRIDCDVANRQRPRAVPPTSPEVPVEGGFPVFIKNPFGEGGISFMVTKEPWRDCDVCDDTGWAKYFCGEEPSRLMPWLTKRRCERRHTHADHDWAQACPCVATNRTIQQRRAASIRYSSDPEKVA